MSSARPCQSGSFGDSAEEVRGECEEHQKVAHRIAHLEQAGPCAANQHGALARHRPEHERATEPNDRRVEQVATSREPPEFGRRERSEAQQQQWLYREEAQLHAQADRLCSRPRQADIGRLVAERVDHEPQRLKQAGERDQPPARGYLRKGGTEGERVRQQGPDERDDSWSQNDGKPGRAADVHDGQLGIPHCCRGQGDGHDAQRPQHHARCRRRFRNRIRCRHGLDFTRPTRSNHDQVHHRAYVYRAHHRPRC